MRPFQQQQHECFQHRPRNCSKHNHSPIWKTHM